MTMNQAFNTYFWGLSKLSFGTFLKMVSSLKSSVKNDLFLAPARNNRPWKSLNLPDPAFPFLFQVKLASQTSVIFVPNTVFFFAKILANLAPLVAVKCRTQSTNLTFSHIPLCILVKSRWISRIPSQTPWRKKKRRGMQNGRITGGPFEMFEASWCHARHVIPYIYCIS